MDDTNLDFPDIYKLLRWADTLPKTCRKYLESK